MNKTILEIVQTVASELALKNNGNVTSVVASSDNLIQQVRRYCEREIQWLIRNYQFTESIKEYTFDFVDGQANYSLPSDFDRFILNTYWDRDQGWPLLPYNAQEWQVVKSSATAQTVASKFRIKGNSSRQFYIHPTPGTSDAGRTQVFEYISQNGIRPQTWESGLVITAGAYIYYDGNYYTALTAGTTGDTAPVHTENSETDGGVTWDHFDGSYTRFLADTDLPLIDSYLVELGTMARYSRHNGLTSRDEIMREYLKEVEKISGAKVPATIIKMGRRRGNYFIDYSNLPDTGYN